MGQEYHLRQGYSATSLVPSPLKTTTRLDDLGRIGGLLIVGAGTTLASAVRRMTRGTHPLATAPYVFRQQSCPSFRDGGLRSRTVEFSYACSVNKVPAATGRYCSGYSVLS